MQNVVLTGDTAGGTITGTGGGPPPRCTVGGQPVAVVGDHVAPHGDHDSDSIHMTEGSVKFTLGGKAVCFVTCSASCGHSATGGTLKLTVGS